GRELGDKKKPHVYENMGLFYILKIVWLRLGLDRIDHIAPRIDKSAVVAAARILKLDPRETRAILVALASTGALPGIGCNMVVIAPGGHEDGPVSIGLNGFEAEFIVPEGFGLLRIANAQMHMAHDRILRGKSPFSAFLLDDIEQIADIKRIGAHGHAITIPLPLVMRTVGIDFDAIALGIGQIDGFAHLVVRRAADRQLLIDGAARPACKVSSRG